MPNLSSGTSSFKRPGAKAFIVCSIKSRPQKGTHSVDSIELRPSGEFDSLETLHDQKPSCERCCYLSMRFRH